MLKWRDDMASKAVIEGINGRDLSVILHNKNDDQKGKKAYMFKECGSVQCIRQAT